jgi:hypothetical protein
MNKRSVITPPWMMLFDSQSSFYSSSCPECRSKQVSQIVKANTCMPTEPGIYITETYKNNLGSVSCAFFSDAWAA